MLFLHKKRMNQQVVVVTGGTDGIGKALVEEYLSRGAAVATCSRTPEKLEALQQQSYANSLMTFVADVSREQDCRDFIAAVLKRFGKIDILINNAGISMRALFVDTELETLKRVMDINFWGAVYCTKFALSSILKNKGSIVGISSVAGFRGLPGRSGYSASKFALTGWLESLRTELLHSGVNVLWVSPGFTRSNIRNTALNAEAKAQKESPLDESKLMTAEECAHHIINAIEKRKRTLVLTFTGKQTVFFNKFFPSLADKLTYKFFYKNGKLKK